MSENDGGSCNPLRFALQMAAATDKLARLHRGVVATEDRVMDGDGGAAAARQAQILRLAERVAAAAESLAESQKKVAVKEHLSKSKRPAANGDATAVKLASFVAKEARKAADKQARSSAVPQACEVEVLAPEWVQQQLRERLTSPAGSTQDQVCSLSDRTTLKLVCPLSGGLLKTPVRGVKCRHIDCFDLESFRQSASLDWRCPMVGCGASVAPELLRRDSFVEAVLLLNRQSLQSITLGPEIVDVQTNGIATKRAQTLARQALSIHLQTTSVKIAVPCQGKAPSKMSLPIEVDDSDSETLPRIKRCRYGRKSSIGGA